MRPQVSFSRPPVANPPQAPDAASANRITTYAEGSEKAYPRDCYCGVGRLTDFSRSKRRRPQAGSLMSDTVRSRRTYTVPGPLFSPKGVSGLRLGGRLASHQ